MRKPSRVLARSACIVFLSLACAHVLAQPPEPEDARGEDTPEPWKESRVELPAYPSDDDAVMLLDLEYREPNYNFYLDKRSLSYGEDSVLRYTVVIESRSGARNVLHEGVRCETKQFKTYAYGTRQGNFKPYTSARWLPLSSVPNHGPMGFRRALARQFLCHREDLGAADVEHVLGRLEKSDVSRIWEGNPRLKDQVF